jgi:pimeloyl-ACP methyl ester carboxylesterase
MNAPVRSFYFGTTRRLYGVMHEPQGSPKATGVLLCYPGVQEYNMTHWAFRKLAGLLVREGYPVMRFDYSCTGDSQGDAYAGSVDAWVEDIASAAEELKDAAGVRRFSIVGMRLGAALAAQALAEGLKASDFILWEPIFGGADYVRELEKLDDAECSRLQHWPMSPRTELAGYPFPSSLRRGLEGIDLSASVPKGCARAALFLSAPAEGAAAVRAAWQQAGVKVAEHVVHEEAGVTSGVARDSAVLYTQMLSAMAAEITAPKAVAA